MQYQHQRNNMVFLQKQVISFILIITITLITKFSTVSTFEFNTTASPVSSKSSNINNNNNKNNDNNDNKKTAIKLLRKKSIKNDDLSLSLQEEEKSITTTTTELEDNFEIKVLSAHITLKMLFQNNNNNERSSPTNNYDSTTNNNNNKNNNRFLKNKESLQNINNKTSIMIILSKPSISDLIEHITNNTTTQETNNKINLSTLNIKENHRIILSEQNEIISTILSNKKNQKWKQEIRIIGQVQYVRNAIFIEVPTLRVQMYCTEIHKLLSSAKNVVKKVIPVENYYSTMSSSSSSPTSPINNDQPIVSSYANKKSILQNSNEVLSYIGATSFHNQNYLGQNITIAIIDSGIDYTHVNFGGIGTRQAYEDAAGDIYNKSNIRSKNRDGHFPTEKIVDGYDFVGDIWPIGDLNPDDDPIDFEGHGTHVADIAAGLTHGVAPEAKLLAIKSCSSISSNICSGAALVQGIEYAVLNKADIINFSIGMSYGQPFDDEVSSVVESATKLGIQTVASSGNTGDRPYGVGVPSSAHSAISVAETEVPKYYQVFSVNNDNKDMIYPISLYPQSIEPTMNISGIIQYGDGLFDNTLACAPFKDSTALLNKIVIIDGFGCSTKKKIEMVAASGAVLVLLSGNFRVILSQPNNEMQTTTTTSIPAYFMNVNDAFTILANIKKDNTIGVLDPSNQQTKAGRTTPLTTRGPDMSYNSIKPEIGAPGAISSAEVGTGSQESLFRGTSGAAPVITGSYAILKQFCSSLSSSTSTSFQMDDHDDNNYCTPQVIKSWLMNYAYSNITSDTTNQRAEITRIGSGEVRLQSLLNISYWAFNIESKQPTISLGLIDAYKDIITITKTIRIMNMYHDRQQSLYITPTFRIPSSSSDSNVNNTMVKFDIRWNGKSSLDDNNNNNMILVTIPECDYIDVDIQFILHSKLLPSNFMSSGENGIDPKSLTSNEIDGYIVISQQQQEEEEQQHSFRSNHNTTSSSSSSSIVLPWHAVIRKAAYVEATTAAPTATTSDDQQQHKLHEEIQLYNRGTGKAQVDIFNVVATSDEQIPGSLGEMKPTPDIKAIGYRTVYNQETIDNCTYSYAIDLAVSTWRRQRHLISVRYIFYIVVYGTFDVESENTTSTSIFNSGPIYDSADVRQKSFVDDVNFGLSSKYFTFHSTNTRNTVIRLCGEQIGLPLQLVQDGQFTIEVRSAMAKDELSDGPGDFLEYFSIVPFGERFHTTFDGNDASSFDLDPGIRGNIKVQENSISSSSSAVKGIMLFTNGDRGEGNRGASSENTEMLLFLDTNVSYPIPIDYETLLTPTPLTPSSSPTQTAKKKSLKISSSSKEKRKMVCKNFSSIKDYSLSYAYNFCLDC